MPNIKLKRNYWIWTTPTLPVVLLGASRGSVVFKVLDVLDFFHCFGLGGQCVTVFLDWVLEGSYTKGTLYIKQKHEIMEKICFF